MSSVLIDHYPVNAFARYLGDRTVETSRLIGFGYINSFRGVGFIKTFLFHRLEVVIGRGGWFRRFGCVSSWRTIG